MPAGLEARDDGVGRGARDVVLARAPAGEDRDPHADRSGHPPAPGPGLAARLALTRRVGSSGALLAASRRDASLVLRRLEARDDDRHRRALVDVRAARRALADDRAVLSLVGGGLLAAPHAEAGGAQLGCRGPLVESDHVRHGDRLLLGLARGTERHGERDVGALVDLFARRGILVDHHAARLVRVHLVHHHAQPGRLERGGGTVLGLADHVGHLDLARAVAHDHVHRRAHSGRLVRARDRADHEARGHVGRELAVGLGLEIALVQLLDRVLLGQADHVGHLGLPGSVGHDQRHCRALVGLGVRPRGPAR